MKHAFLALAVAVSLSAQTKLDLARQATNADFSAYPSTKPVKVGTSLPGTCATGALYFKSDATAGSNLYGCVSNTWYWMGSVTSADLANGLATKANVSHSHIAGDIAAGSKTGNAAQLVTAAGPVADGCSEWSSGNLTSTGTPCGSGGGGGTTYSVASASQSFTSSASVTITHNFNSLKQVVSCYDASHVKIQPASVTLGLADTVIGLTGTPTGECVVVGGTGLYSESFTSQTSVNLDHDFNTQLIIVGCVDGSNVVIEPDTVTATDANNATVTFTSAQTGSCHVAAALAGGGGGGGTGTVTSVGLSAPSEFTLANTPITGAGTIGIAWASQAAARVLAAPASSSGTPSFRALVGGDLPAMVGDSGSGGTKGAVPAPAAGDAAAGKYLKADGSWQVPPGGGGGGSYTAGDGIDSTSLSSSIIAVDATVPAIAVSGSQSLTFGTIAAGSCSVQTITATGATVGDRVAPGWPATLPDGVLGIMFVSATDTLSVRLCKISTGSADVTGLTFTYQISRAR